MTAPYVAGYCASCDRPSWGDCPVCGPTPVNPEPTGEVPTN